MRNKKQIKETISKIGKFKIDFCGEKTRMGIVMDEIDGIESKKECSSNDLIEFINYTNIQHQKKIKKENKKRKNKIKKLRTVLPNKNPIICICNFIPDNKKLF